MLYIGELFGRPGIIASLFACAAILVVICLSGLVVLYLNYGAEHRPEQALFRSGIVPAVLPDGFYKGDVAPGIPRKGWQGKVFDAQQSRGINQFIQDQRYVFAIYPAMGLRDRRTAVLRIDYKQPGNPWWLRFIVDEIVQTTPGHFLGKVHVHVLPGLTGTLMYFELSQTNGDRL